MNWGNIFTAIAIAACFSVAVILVFNRGAPYQSRSVTERNHEQKLVDRKTSVVSRLDLGDDGTVVELTVPDPVLPGSPLLDSRCLIYVNKEFRQAVMKCLPRTGPAAE